jgi:hypothetical protein
MPARRNSAQHTKNSRAHCLPTHSPALSLDVDAKSGTYRIDEIAEELYKQGVLLNREPFELLLKKFRHSVDIAGCLGLGSAQAELLRAPEHRRLTKRFFEDIKVISHLIERNKKADAFYISFHVRARRSGCLDRTSRLLTMLREVRSEIESYLSDYRPDAGRGGNRDARSYDFISEMLDVWRDFCNVPSEQAAAERAYGETLCDVPKMFRSEYRPFARLLAAAWRDLGFPLVDHRNESREPLEDWFADRVRKQFPDDGLSADF